MSKTGKAPDVDGPELRGTITSEAKRLGIDLIGFAGVERWGQFPYPRERFYPRRLWPWSQTVISAGVRILLPMLETTPSALYAELYNTTNRLLDEAAYRLANLLNDLGYRAFFFPRDGYGDISALVEKPEAAFSQVIAAKFAGLGTIGANHCLLTPEYGPRVRFVSVITSAKIPGDPLIKKELCSQCGRCKNACPIKAFEPLPGSVIARMDRRRCARYHHLLRKEMRYPCGVCTLVCPVGNDQKMYEHSVSEDGIFLCQDRGARRNFLFNAAKKRFIMSNENYQFETLQIHVGQEQPDPATDARAVPVYQTSSYVFKDTAQAAGRFALTEQGNIYTRIMNPTWDVFEQRIAALEKGAAALAAASGAAATTYAVQNITRRGDHIVSDFQIYGGTFNLFANTFKDFGVDTTFVDGGKAENFEAAIRANTKALFFETIGNPNASVVDIEAVAEIAHKHGIPLIVDNTFATPYLLRPIEYGADIVVHSATKFIGGHGTSIGGVIVDAGKFDWAANNKFPGLCKPNPSYHGVVFTDAAKNLAYIIKARTTLLRDTGAALSPFNAFLFLQGLETLSLRVERHVENALKVVDFLKNHPQVEKVNHPALAEHRDNALYRRYFPLGGASIFTFEIKGGIEAAKSFIAGLKLFSLLANVADVKSLVIHPASTTHSQVGEKDLLEQGIKPNTIRLSIGTEHITDIINDLTYGFEGALTG